MNNLIVVVVVIRATYFLFEQTNVGERKKGLGRHYIFQPAIRS